MFLPYYTVTGGITIPSTWDRDPFWDPFLKKKQQLMGHGQKMVIFGITTSTLKQRIFQTDEGKKEAAATKLKGRLTITGWWLTYPS